QPGHATCLHVANLATRNRLFLHHQGVLGGWRSDQDRGTGGLPDGRLARGGGLHTAEMNAGQIARFVVSRRRSAAPAPAVAPERKLSLDLPPLMWFPHLMPNSP